MTKIEVKKVVGLSSCPFCGKDPSIVWDEGINAESRSLTIKCSGYCGLKMSAKDATTAAENWNRRPYMVPQASRRLA